MSPRTGGPLCGDEAVRVVTGRSISVAGVQFMDGRVACREHEDRWIDGAGFKMPVYCGTTQDVDLGACAFCAARVVGEPREPTRGI